MIHSLLLLVCKTWFLTVGVFMLHIKLHNNN